MPDETIFNRKRVIIDVQYGLSNRLRALASANLIAEKLNRELILIWTPDLHCNCKFDDLFVNRGLNVFDSIPFDLSLADCYDYMNAPLRRANQLAINYETTNDIYVSSAYTLDYPSRNMARENEFLRSLRPVVEVEETLDNYNLSELIGLHIRMGAGKNYDKDRWDSDEFFDETGKELMHYWRARSHYNVFIPIVEEILKNNPAQKFYLAADMQIIYYVFTEKFGNSIVYHKRHVYDRSKQQQITALVDLYCLSRTKMIYGSTWSAFTEVARRIGGIPYKLSGRDFGNTEQHTL